MSLSKLFNSSNDVLAHQVGSVQASKCVAYGQGLVAGEAGIGEAFTIQSVDQFGHNLTEGGLFFEVSMISSQSALSEEGPLTPRFPSCAVRIKCTQ